MLKRKKVKIEQSKEDGVVCGRGGSMCASLHFTQDNQDRPPREGDFCTEVRVSLAYVKEEFSQRQRKELELGLRPHRGCVPTPWEE